MRFVLRYDNDGRARLAAAERERRSVDAEDLRRMDEGLAQLEVLTALVPECSGDVHVLSGIGRVGNRPAQILIIWTPFQITVSHLLPPDDRRCPRRGEAACNHD